MQECLYAIYKNERFTRYIFSNNSILPPKDLALQPTKRFSAGIAKFDDCAIFLIGGDVYVNATNTCAYYLILQDKWYEAPSLKEARNRNNSCSLGRYVYTFGGYDDAEISTIERLDAKSLLDGVTVTWTLI